MANKQAAVVVVLDEWVSTSPIKQILGVQQHGSGRAHLFIAGSVETDGLGVWLKEITTDAIVDKADGAPTTLDFLVPWPYVLAVGVWDEQTEKVTVGFQAWNRTSVQDRSSGPDRQT
jgi:hypothetical protein